LPKNVLPEQIMCPLWVRPYQKLWGPVVPLVSSILKKKKSGPAGYKCQAHKGGPISAAKSCLGGPILAAKSGLGRPLLAAKVVPRPIFGRTTFSTTHPSSVVWWRGAGQNLTKETNSLGEEKQTNKKLADFFPERSDTATWNSGKEFWKGKTPSLKHFIFF